MHFRHLVCICFSYRYNIVLNIVFINMEHSARSLNKFIGKLNITLRNIVNGPTKRLHIVQGTEGADRKGILKLSYSFSI